MTDSTPIPMHPDFPRWYREVSVDEDRERIQRRWNGVALIVPSLDRAVVENILRMLFRSPTTPSAETTANLRKIFKSADDLFDMQGNDRELEVLCGSILAVLLEQHDDLAAWSALAITTTSLNGKRVAHLPIDLVVAAENAIRRVAERNRARPRLQDVQLATPTVSFAKAKEKIQAGIDAANLNSAFDGAAEATTLVLGNIVSKFNSAIDKMADFITIQDEEIEFLWWVLGERSYGVKMPFKLIPKEARPLIFGSELADATVYLPGPLSIEGILGRAGLKATEQITLQAAVNKCETSWLELMRGEKTYSPLSQPIHFAIQRKLETGDDSSWLSGWAASCGIDVNAALPSIVLGNLFYRERLLSIF